MFLFADFATTGLKPAADFQAIAAQRIQQHQQAEAARTRAEDEAKARAEDEAKARAAAALQQAAAAQVVSDPAPVVASPAPAVAVQSPQADGNTPMLRLGQINELLAPVKIDAGGLATLGFQPAAKDKSALLYLTSDLPVICDAIVKHVRGVCVEVAA